MAPRQAFLTQPHLARHQLSLPLAAHIRPVADAQRAGGQLYRHWLLLGPHLLATLDLQARFDTSERAQLGGGLRDVALLPLSLPVLEGDFAIRVIDAHDQMLLLLPNRAPHRHIIKATI